jgi:hypothetical protein
LRLRSLTTLTRDARPLLLLIIFLALGFRV